MKTLVTLAALLAMLVPTGAVGQSATHFTAVARGTWSTSIGGFRVHSSEGQLEFGSDVTPAFGLGATLALGFDDSPLSLRADLDYRFDSELESDETTLVEQQTGGWWWATGSVGYRPRLGCTTVCATAVSLGAGLSRFVAEYDQTEFGITVDYVDPQIAPAVRVGVDLSFPTVARGLVLQVADYLTFMDPADDEMEAGPVNVIFVGVGWAVSGG